MNRTNRHGAHDALPDDAWLAAALREQAHQHEADSRRINTTFEHLIAGERGQGEPRRAQPRPTGPRRAERPHAGRRPAGRRHAEPRRFGGPARIRLIGIPVGLLVLGSAAVAVAASLGLGNTPAAHPSSTLAASQGGGPGATAATSGPGPLSASSAALPTATGPTATGPTATGPAATTQPATTPASTATSATGPAGPLTAAGTVDPHSTQYWAQENLTVTTTHPIRELDVTVNVSGGQSVRSTGMWTTLLPPQVATTVHGDKGGLVYEITLKPGQTLQPTAYGFGFQFNRPSAGHEFALDTYHVTAVTTDGATESASGAF
jgi:hypothetical protein